jgi:uncharacterized protein (TIGR02217 family)
MGIVETNFPDNIAYGSQSGPSFNTSIVRTTSGRETRNARWQVPLRQLNVKYGIRSIADLHTVIEFYNARRGPHIGFRIKDFLDYSTDPNHTPESSAPDFEDVVIGTGDGSTTEFQLVKKYTDAGETTTYNIEKPVSGTIVVGVNGVEKTITTDFTVSTVTGVVTFLVAPPLGEDVTAGCDYDIPARFGKEVDLNGLLASIDGIEYGSIPDIPIVELRNENAVSDELFTGGTKDIASLTVDTTISPLDGRLIRVLACNGTAKLLLDDVSTLAPGGPYHYVVNLDSTNSLPIEDQDGTTVDTIPAGEARTLVIAAQLATVASETWYCTAVADHITMTALTGLDFETSLSETAVSSSTVTLGPTGGFQNDDGTWTSPAGEPNVLEWQTGDWVITYEISSTGAAMELQSQVHRIDSTGTTLVESSALTTRFGIPTAGTYVDTISSVSWSTGGSEAVSDLMVVEATSRNSSGSGSPSVVFDCGAVGDTRVAVPVVDQATLFRWVSID